MHIRLFLNCALILLFSFSNKAVVQAQICVGTSGEVTWSYWRHLEDDGMGELYADEYYPHTPDGIRIINSVRSPVRFDNQFGSTIRGFISIPTSESLVFNITGDDEVRFFLSSDEQPDNLVEEAFILGHTGEEEHDKYPEQTTRSISLVSGQYYYFELHHIEGGGGDHVALWWKTTFTGLTNWNYVTSQYINNVGCEDPPCLERGTSCDDGDATTTDDIEDGYCNCIGIAQTTNTCIGERGTIGAYYYDNIPGGDIEDLYEYPDFPAMPDRYEALDMMGIGWSNSVDSFGTLIQGFISVPVTGDYQFNITSNSEGIFFLSSNEDPALKQTHQILNTSTVDPTEHDRFIYQSTAPLFLEKGKYYFFELNHKESSYSEHYSIFWKTPFTGEDNWKRIPSIFLYDYDCELACISEGTPCDDGDIFTNNDAFDDNCNCVGTPCSGPDCDDPLASYVPYPECGLTDQLDNRADASWLSCVGTASPNPTHGTRHWLQYDLGSEYKLWSTHVWNYNVSGSTLSGFENVAVDYSMDGVNWTSLGTYNWQVASGADDYSGFIGPDFGGIRARYILVTSLDDIAECRGISKMTFATQQCGEVGSVCDDDDPDTVNDRYDADCNCTGVRTTFNDCSQDTLMLGDSTLSLARYSAIRFVGSSSSIPSSQEVLLMAIDGVELMPGFTGEIGALLTLQIDDCEQILSLNSPKEVRNLKNQLMESSLVVIQVENTQDQIIGFYVEEPGLVQLEIRDQYDNYITSLMNHEVKNTGYYTKRIRTKRLTEQRYKVVLTTKSMHESEVMTIGFK